MQKFTFTQHEKDFVVEFLADILHGLTMNNVLSRQEYNGFIRMQDALEVLEHLKMLYNKHTDEEDFVWGGTVATWTFTLEDARDALTNYDTEYREGICEQFEDRCTDALADAALNKLDADYATLAERVTGY
jgi:hypothetical protein|tara:strand:+ start:734 stop:1126 length:393 start_codon:yes stop_codon:yes gene_type:complete